MWQWAATAYSTMQHISASTHAACYDAVGNHGMHGKQDQPRSSALLPDSVFFEV